MKSFLLSCLLALTATVASAQLKQTTLEEAAAKRWSQLNSDRIAADGSTANKVGTYPLAVLAARHGIPFLVAAPLSSVANTPGLPLVGST